VPLNFLTGHDQLSDALILSKFPRFPPFRPTNTPGDYFFEFSGQFIFSGIIGKFGGISGQIPSARRGIGDAVVSKLSGRCVDFSLADGVE